MKRNPLSFRSRCVFWTKVTLWALFWGFPIGLVGVLACVLVVTAPFGFAILALAAYPLSRMVKRRGEEVHKWNTSPTPGMTTTDVAFEMSNMMDDEPWNER